MTPRTSRIRRGGITATAALLACSALTLIGTTVTGGRQAAAAGAACPWAGSHAPIATRVGEVLGAMTLDDKLAMVDGTGYESGTTGYVGSVAANPGLCIPALTLEDGPQGVADGVPGVTQLPAPVALASSFDP